jgi:hypothetical protein
MHRFRQLRLQRIEAKSESLVVVACPMAFLEDQADPEYLDRIELEFRV